LPAEESSRRIRWIAHKDRQIILVDFSHCSAAEVEKILREVPDVVTTRPRSSVLILSDFTGASFNDEAIRAMKEAAVFDKPYIKKTAWLGAEYIPPEFVDVLRSFSRREFPAFKSREEALAWLVTD
jgi:hypothetical protein